jgi:hypothetical protein
VWERVGCTRSKWLSRGFATTYRPRGATVDSLVEFWLAEGGPLVRRGVRPSDASANLIFLNSFSYLDRSGDGPVRDYRRKWDCHCRSHSRRATNREWLCEGYEFGAEPLAKVGSTFQQTGLSKVARGDSHGKHFSPEGRRFNDRFPMAVGFRRRATFVLGWSQVFLQRDSP